ncbi:carcinoembryonic antigen-related cell adhesion molecule 20 [Neoarius graeffei]|uniref:carcinoembryonic antigen-related cell adhesion molecule 20 n=1 Tax=Neoarius graeffei TaxID=443677 RepID=UPI00298C06D4|nr:carcinoembryonic antigen-related cell adhesion molecule 20 [Neoarius graeffei]
MDLYNSWLILIFLAQTGFCSSELEMPAELSGVRGKSVNFTASIPPLTAVETVAWAFIPLTGPSVPICTATKTNAKVSQVYEGRVKYYRSENTLEFSSLIPTDGGTYSLTIVDSELRQLVGHTSLRVLEPVADVTIISNLPEAVEFNSTVILNCSAKGSSLSYSWMNNSAPVVVDDKHIVQKGNQLIINEIFRTDLLGPISCKAENQLESSTSDTFNLTVNYGPEHVTKAQEPAVDVLQKGSNLTLSCSAQSYPAAEFTWLINEAKLLQKTATVVLSNLVEEQSGNYSCMAYNSKTLRYVSSEVTELSVVEAISGTNISASTLSLIAGNTTVNLTCTSRAGTADSVQWQKDGKLLDNTDRVIFNTDKSTLTILTVQKEDAGEYNCQLKNKISSEASNYKMIVNYGPENVAIKAKNQVMMGQSVQITCSYASFPVPTFTWKFNDSIMHGEEKECLEIPNFQDKNGGIYTCEAFNSITGLKKSATYNLMVKDSNPNQEGLSSGAIAGIVIAVLLVLAIIIGVCIHKRRKISDVPSPY